jgi:hypothetical protein
VVGVEDRRHPTPEVIWMRNRLLSLTAAILLVLGLGPTAGALPLPVSLPVLMTDNVELVGFVPDVTIVSATFDPEKPVMYTTTLSGFRAWDVSNPELPTPLGYLPFPHYSNENMKLGVREDGTRLVLAGFDLVGYAPQAGLTDLQGTQRFVVIDVTDPRAPSVASSIDTGPGAERGTRTHTMGCANRECTHAYTSGSGSAFKVYDLTDITAPTYVRTVEALQGRNDTFGSGIGHDWDIDGDGVAWLVGTGGITAFDVSDPADPRILNHSDHRSRDAKLNRYVSHNSQRPNADQFVNRDDEDLLPITIDSFELEERDPSDLRPGEVLFVTEEDLSSDPSCSARGGFQAWHVQQLDADWYDEFNPVIDEETGERRYPEDRDDSNVGTIAPIGFWSTEAAEVDDPVAAANLGAFCSAHYFDTHVEAGIVAHAWYQQGLRFLDVRDPTNIKQVGYFITGVQEVFGAKWVPEYDEDGRQTGAQTNIVYTEDLSRGIDILRVDLDLPDVEDTEPLRAPILPQWRVKGVELATRLTSPGFGLACVLP